MPRIRSIKPEAPQHRKVGRLSDRAFRVWTVMLTQADDEGRLVCDASQVRVWGFSYHRDVSDHEVEDAIQEVARPGLIRLYSVNGTRYAVFPSWLDHQRINRPNPSKLPPPPSLLDVLPVPSMTDHGALTEDSLSVHGSPPPGSDQGSRIKDQGSEGIKEGKGSEGIQGEPRGGKPTAALRSASPPEAASLRAPDLEADPAGEPAAAWEGKNREKPETAPETTPKPPTGPETLSSLPPVSVPPVDEAAKRRGRLRELFGQAKDREYAAMLARKAHYGTEAEIQSVLAELSEEEQPSEAEQVW